jgi:two-component system chemotaxis response regulator CheY
MRQIIKGFLHQQGLRRIMEADNGVGALALLRGGGVDLLITDQNMPRMSGIELTRKIRQDPALASLPIIMMSAESKREQIVAAMQAGVNEYLVKPFPITALLDKIERLFGP